MFLLNVIYGGFTATSKGQVVLQIAYKSFTLAFLAFGTISNSNYNAVTNILFSKSFEKRGFKILIKIRI